LDSWGTTVAVVVVVELMAGGGGDAGRGQSATLPALEALARAMHEGREREEVVRECSKEVGVWGGSRA
jgi:hypothetical protein